MRGLPINVQLIVLVVVNETTTLLEDGEVRVITLRQQVQVIPMRQLGPDLYRLPIRRVEFPESVNVGPVALLSTLAKPDLRFTEITLQVVVNDIEVLEGRELGVGDERRLDEELALLGVDVEPVAGVDADLLAHARDQPVHLLVEIGGVVDHVEVWVTDPCRRRVVVELPGQFHAFRPASVILSTRVKV